MLTKVPPSLIDPLPLGAVNRIINGKFVVDQRRGSRRVQLGVPIFSPDRWMGWASAPASFDMTPSNSAGIGSLMISPVTLDDAPAAGQVCFFAQRVEGWNLVDLQLGRGTSAKPFVLAFEVAGTYPTIVGQPLPVSFRNEVGSLSYVASYTINAVNTYETKVIVVPPTTGFPAGFNYATGIGLHVDFGLCLGSNYHAPALNQWMAGNYLSHASLFNFMGQQDASLLFRNIRLYPGTVDLGVDSRLFAEELALCQRYYWKTFAQNVAPVQNAGSGANTLAWTVGTAANGRWGSNVNFPVVMRAVPAITTFNPLAANADAGPLLGGAESCGVSVAAPNERGFLFINTTSPATVPQTMIFHATADAEL